MLNIRPANEKDVQTITNIKIETWEHTYTRLINKQQLDFFLSSLKKNNDVLDTLFYFQLMVIEFENKIVGYFTYDISTDNDIYLYELYISPEYQGKKLGSQCIAYLENLNSEAEHITLEVIVNNLSALNFYDSVGFKITKRYKHNGPIDTEVFEMKKQLFVNNLNKQEKSLVALI